ncbi:MAG: S8 family serine peptidase [Gammaproteobacteria bacterium]|nr:S8 family serine peptidase [Gammaproteobacteria bacterium]
MKTALHAAALGVSVLLLLGGCGGGGDSTPAGPPPDISVSVATSGDGEGSVTPGNTSVPRGQTLSFTLDAAESSELISVTGCGGTLQGNTYTTGPINSACSVQVRFDLRRYEVSIATTGNGEGSVNPPGTTQVAHGQRLTLELDPAISSLIAGAEGCDGAIEEATFTTGPVTAACDITVTFALRRYDVTVRHTIGGFVDPLSITLEHGSSSTFSLSPDVAYELESIGGCAGELEDGRFVLAPVTGSCELEAIFALRSFSFDDGVAVSGFPVKGPLAGAVVRVFRLTEPWQDGLEQLSEATLVTAGRSTAQARLEGLEIPAGIDGWLIVDVTPDEHTLDLTTGAPPRIGRMRSIIDAAQWRSGTPVVISPLTEAVVALAARRGGVTEFADGITQAQAIVEGVFGFGVLWGIDVFTHPPLLTSDPDQDVEAAFRHRLAIESLASLADTLAGELAARGISSSADAVFRALLEDIAADDVIDGLGAAGADTLLAGLGDTLLDALRTPPQSLALGGSNASLISGLVNAFNDETTATGASTEQRFDLDTLQTPPQPAAQRSFLVRGTASPGGQLTPTQRQVGEGNTLTFTLSRDLGFLLDGIDGCDGSLSETRYTIAPATRDCSVTAALRRPQVSGTVTAVPGSAVDGTLNDPGAALRSNTSFETSQLLASPVVLGGYVNRAGRGPVGRSFATGNVRDHYQLSLTEGQSVVLYMDGDGITDDLDLILYDVDGFIVDASAGIAPVESLVIPADGEYVIAVSAWQGGANYRLEIDDGPPPVDTGMRLSDAFVPDEVIIKLHPSDVATSSRLREDLASLQLLRPETPGTSPRSKLLRLDESHAGRYAIAAVSEAMAHRDQLLSDARLPARFRSEATRRAFETLLMVKALHHDPGTEGAWLNQLYRPLQTGFPDDPRFPEQWHYTLIDTPDAWTLSNGEGVVVAVIDTGGYLDHPDLQGQWVPGWDFLLNLPGGDDPGGDRSFHGTHVAGTIAAATNNGLGVAGVAYGARIMPLRVCVTTCPGFAILQALRFAAGLENDSGSVPDVPAQVINLSLGRDGGGPSSLEAALYAELRDLNISVVAAAGNTGQRLRSYPAAYDTVISVAAVTLDATRAPYSSYGPWVDVAAPGGSFARGVASEGVLSTVANVVTDTDEDGNSITRREADYGWLQGTSMAAPHVAGVVALMRGAEPRLTAQDIEFLLRNRALTEDIGEEGRDEFFGWGLINAFSAVQAALATNGEPVELLPYMEPDFDFRREGFFGLGGVALFQNTGGGVIEYGEPTSEDAWLQVIGAAASDGELAVEYAIDREGLAAGVYIGTLRVPSENANTGRATLIIRVGEARDSEVPTQYVMLLDEQAAEELRERRPISDVARFLTRGQALGDGRQAFTLAGVEPGRYVLVSGSDMDNDGFACGAFEACGAHLDSDREFVVIDIDGESPRDVEGIEFEVDFIPPDVEALMRGDAHPLRLVPGEIPLP